MNTKYLVEYEYWSEACWSEAWRGGNWDDESKSFDTLKEATKHADMIKSRHGHEGSEGYYPVRNIKVYRKTEIK
jgi:hypothetical protein